MFSLNRMMMTERHSSCLTRIFNVLVLIVLFLLSCSEKKRDNAVVWIKPEKLEKTIERADSVYVIIPVVSCEFCSRKLLNNSNRLKDNIKLILIPFNAEQVKIARQNLGDYAETVSSTKILIDTTGKFVNYLKRGTYSQHMIIYAQDTLYLSHIDLSNIEHILSLLSDDLKKVYSIKDVEIKPEPLSGMKDYYNYLSQEISRNYNYPGDSAKRVIFDVILNEKGLIEQVNAIAEKDTLLINLVREKIKNGPPWKPAYHQHQYVPVNFQLPLLFIPKSKEKIKNNFN